MSQEDQAPRRVGERLRQAREQQGIAIADAAERLHILASYIKALESGRYGVLPGTVFLRGYVRSYARLLQLDADEIVAQLDRELGASDDSQAFRPGTVPSKSETRSTGKWLGVAALILLIVGVGWYVQQQWPLMPEETAPSTVEQTSPIDESEVANPEEAFEFEPGPAEPVDRPAAYDDDLSQAEENSVPPEMGGAEDEPLPDASAESEVLISSQEPEAVSSDAAVDDENSAGVAPQGELPEGGEQAASVDRLEVSFSGESWFELTDAEGNRRVGLFQAGQTLNHQGPAPFRVVVGAVSETSMRFNGVAVDFSNYRVRNNRAGLTLGQ